MQPLSDVNSHDLLGAIRLGCATMAGIFDADDPHDAPFFDAVALPEPRLAFSTAHSEAHVPGRHLNALLSAEGLAGVPFDESAIERHARALFFSYSGEVPLPLNRARRDGPLELFCPHNLREGFHGLAALAAWRGSGRALEMAAASIELIGRSWTPGGGWTLRVDPDCAGLTLVQGLGRAVGPLVKLWRATGHEPAIDLARRVADIVVETAFPGDGAFRSELLGTHVHSITSTLSSLAQLADAQADAALLDRVRAFYRKGLHEIRDQLGWAIESTAPDANPDKGECNSSGDIVETALILGHHGDADADDDVEQVTRAHLLPSQLRDISFIPASAETDDGTHEVARRLRGSFGFPAPYGHRPLGLPNVKFNLDVVGGTVASLVEVAAAAVNRGPDGLAIRFAFDLDRPGLQVHSVYAGPADGIKVDAGRGTIVRVRMPGWSDRPGWQTFRQDGDAPLRIALPLASRDLVLRHRTRGIGVRLRGDTVEAMEDVGADLTFFPALGGA